MKRHLACLAAVYVLVFSWPALAAVNIAVDIDSTRLSGSNTSGTFTTQTGFTSWDLTNVGTSGSTLTLDGVTFEIFGLAAANQSRVRTSGGGGGACDALLADFVYNEGASGRGIGLRITGLSVGTYAMQSWHYDSGIGGDNFIQVEVRNQGDATWPTVISQRPFGLDPASFTFEVTQAGQVKEIVFREADAPTETDPTDSNRARLNGFTLTPEPVSLALVLLAAGVSSIRRRR